MATPPSMPKRSPCRRIRLGHAFRTSPGSSDTADLVEVIRILRGEEILQPRNPVDADCVLQAEKWLGACDRLIYTFSGCLHPKLGTIGLVISPDILDRNIQGVSRCDTGGLVGRKGAFANIPQADIEGALKTLSFKGTDHSWESEFSNEIDASYSNSRDYVAGRTPDHAGWGDIRSVCIGLSGPETDRRIWTWEIRLIASPSLAGFEGLVLSPEAFKRLEALRRSGQDVPESVRIVHGTTSLSGVHYFNDDAVVDLLNGEDQS